MSVGPPSPFLPDRRQWAWNSTSLGLAKDCARKYQYVMLQGWSKKEASHHLIFGMHYAKASELFHKWLAQGKDFEFSRHHVVRQILIDSFGWESEDPAKNRQNLIRSIVWYLEEFRNDPCETVILADGSPAIELKFEMHLSDEVVLTGHIDRLVRYAGGVYVQDQKTTGATLSPYYFKRFNPDNQMSLYSVASRVVYNTPVQGVMIDAAQVAIGFTRFARGFTYRTEQQCDEWLADAEYHIQEAWRAERAGYPMRDTACQKYGGCQFLEVCSKDSRVRGEYLASDFETRFHNPLEIR